MNTNLFSYDNSRRKPDFKENIRKVLKNHKYVSNFQPEYGKDLADYIPGLYRLLDLYKDDDSNGFVDKIIISKDSLKKLCNDMVPYSFKSISDINYTKLNSISFRLIGCYGNYILIAKLLLNKEIINKRIYDVLIAPQSSDINKSSLRPGIYLLLVNPDLGLVIHWPEVGCYEEAASFQHKKNMINLHRYLTKLTDHQFCLMSDKDLENFDWNLNNSNVDSDDACYEFEVKKSQYEQEDFKVSLGFKVNLSNEIKTEINNNIQDDIPLHPIVVESATNQSFVTRQLIKKPPLSRKLLSTFTEYDFQRELNTLLEESYLHINRESMNIESLKILIKYGLKMEELLGPLYSLIQDAKLEKDIKCSQEKDAINKYIEIISNLARKKLRESYSPFEDFIDQSSSGNSPQENISDNDLERIRIRYPDIESKIDEKIKINSKAWEDLKKRYISTSLIVFDISKMIDSKVAETKMNVFYNMFTDDPLKHSCYSTVFDFTPIPSSVSLANEKSDEELKKVSDIEFIQDLVNSPFFGKFDDVREKIIDAFFEEYKNWRTKTFPSNIREIFRVEFTELLEKLNEELERKIKEIETYEFERICKVIEEKFRNGSKRLIINNINITIPELLNRFYPAKYKFDHEMEITRPSQLQITIYETLLEQTDTLKLYEDEFYISNPALQYSRDQFGTSFNLDPQVYDFRKISQFDNRKFLLVLWNKNMKRIEIFFDTAHKLAQTFQRPHSIKPFKILNTGENYFIAVNEPRELIAIFDTKKVELNIFVFNDGQANLCSRGPAIHLLQWYNCTVPNIQHFLFIKDTEDLCFVEKGGRARKFNLINQQFCPAICNLPPNTTNVLSSPDGSCIVAFVKEKIPIDVNERETDETGSIDSISSTDTDDEEQNYIKEGDVKEICRAYVYFCANFGGSVSKIVELPPTIQYLEFLQFTRVNKQQTHLMSLDLQNGFFSSAMVKVTVEKIQYRFQGRVQKKSPGLVKISQRNTNYTIIEGKGTRFEKKFRNEENIVIMGKKYRVLEVISNTKLKIAGDLNQIGGFDKWMEFRRAKLNGLIDAYGLMFEKYPVENCMDPEQNRPLSLKIVLDVEENDNDIEKYNEKFKEYITETLEELKRSTKKPASTLKKFTTSVITFQELDIENAKFQKKFSSEYELGEWIIQLCCLIPIQIAVARNNLFQPLKDGLSSNEIDQTELDDSHHVDSIAKNISFGWYEGIFKHFGDKKVKVVSSMGEQSCGKSFMLNHLVGTTFDSFAMHRTEGVWMSLVNTREYIYVALYFEGLKSLEKTLREDSFLTLFNTAVSNLILFKNQFALNRDMSAMFQRFQYGAMLFEADSKIFQAKLCIIIKDVPRNDKEEIFKEFNLKLSQLVLEEGEDNFISRMYKGGLDIIPWPMFNDSAWFKTLSTINKKLDKQKAKYENARIFLQNTKVIMAKLKICDCGSLDENLMQIRVATLKRLLPTAVSHGFEQKDSVTEQLMNRDTGEPIGDPVVSLSKILHDFEDSNEICPDSDIQLYDEQGSFEQLSEDLRDYFEEIVQPRRESLDDNKWFADLDKLFRFIIERRVSRVQDWYIQNTAKFPQDNSDVVNGKYAMEQETSKLTLFWTLCGLTCHDCGLRCVKNRDHKDDHDCLTDHKCYIPCQFTEAHNKITPRCSHKAGHEGKHACNKVSHLCGKPCYLIDKRNCQKVCSNEIGHDGEHLCQSKRHYCGKDCSLSTHTQKGDYRCSNKCIILYEEEHDLHRCEYETCPIRCSIPDCNETCQSDDHFHSDSEPQVDHFCRNEHQCRELCEDDGICRVITEPRKQEKTSFTEYIQLSERLLCSKKIPPNEFKHTGKHSHEENGFHYCDAKCQFCEYFCTLPYGHTQIHETRHGNMINMTQGVDDQGTSVLCNLYCKDAGRHRHIDYCQSVDNCRLGQDIQHINEKVKPNPDKPKDFISHKLFWKRTGFKDPYSAQEQQEFAKCDHECPDEKHHKSQGSSAPPTKSFCESQLFHAPHNPSLDPPNNYGYVSLDGHHFNCESTGVAESLRKHKPALLKENIFY